MKFFVVALAILSASCAYAAIPPQVRAGPECQAPNGGGLQPVLEEFVELLPIEKLLLIYLTAVSSDPEVQEVMAWLESEDFHKIVNAIQAAPQFYTLTEYACEKLYLDVYYYFNLIGGILGLQPVTRPPKINTILHISRARSGLHGMLLDMLDVIPIDEVKALFEEKIASDEYVKLALELLSSDDFKNIVNTLESLPEYQEGLDKLRGMGIDVDEIIDLIKKFFGW